MQPLGADFSSIWQIAYEKIWKIVSSVKEKIMMFKEKCKNFINKPEISLPPKLIRKETIKVPVINSGDKGVEDGKHMSHEIIKFIGRWKNPVEVSFDDY